MKKSCIVTAVVIASLLNFSPSVHAMPTNKTFRTCVELEKKWNYAIARDDASRTRYINYQRNNYKSETRVVVRGGVYRKNSFLDTDRDGVLCEEHFERRDKIGLAGLIAFCVLTGGDWRDGRCVK